MNWVCTSIRLCVCAYPWCCGGALLIIRRKRLCDYILLAKRDGRGLEIRFYYNNTLVFGSIDAIDKQKCVFSCCASHMQLHMSTEKLLFFCLFMSTYVCVLPGRQLQS